MPATFPPAASPPWEPSPPGRPEGPPAPARPAGLWSGAPSLEAQLLDRRVVRLWGPLDDASVGRACAEMMALDATGDAAVQLYVGSSGGPLHLALTLIDTMDLLGVPVHVTCLGRAQGAVIGVVAAGARRAAAPHAQFYLSEPEVSVSGRASQLAAWADHHRAQLERFVQRLAEATGRPAEHVEADLSIGRWLDAEQARQYGLVDYIWGPGGPARPEPQTGPARPLGFGPGPRPAP
ncbi:MAG: ATP-dependent Clp protease proteolytic subunit [Acidimicrobiales bacterium]